MEGSTGLLAGIPNTALDEVWTTFDTPAASQARNKTLVPSMLTERSNSGSLASGTWATLWNTTSIPAHASATVAGSRMSPRINSTSAARLSESLRSSVLTVWPAARSLSTSSSPK